MPGHTLLLDTDAWDLTLDSGGNIATGTGSYAIAQNVANAVRLFTNDAWYAPDEGIPHFMVELGTLPEQSVVRSRVTQAALGVDGVVAGGNCRFGRAGADRDNPVDNHRRGYGRCCTLIRRPVCMPNQ